MTRHTAPIISAIGGAICVIITTIVFWPHVHSDTAKIVGVCVSALIVAFNLIPAALLIRSRKTGGTR